MYIKASDRDIFIQEKPFQGLPYDKWRGINESCMESRNKKS